MHTVKRLERSGAHAPKGLVDWLVDAIYEASLRRALRSIRPHLVFFASRPRPPRPVKGAVPPIPPRMSPSTSPQGRGRLILRARVLRVSPLRSSADGAC